MKKASKNRNVIAVNNSSDTMSNEVQPSYEHTFLQIGTMQQRGNKSIYVSPEHHERLTRIMQIIGNDKIPLYAYLNNILEHHFSMFEEPINKEFKEKYKGPF